MIGQVRLLSMPRRVADSPIPSSLTAHVISTLSGISLQLQETLTVDGLSATAGFVNSVQEEGEGVEGREGRFSISGAPGNETTH